MSAFWQEVFTQPVDTFRKLEGSQRLAVLAALSIAIVGTLIGILVAGRTDWSLLYAGIPQDDAAKIVTQLEQDGTAYKIEAGGAAIYVPEEDVNGARIRLAGFGLPTHGGVGFEIFDDKQLGVTEALHNVNLQRAIAGEVERAIETMAAVRDARVIINLPKTSAFIGREQLKPTAGITLSLRLGSQLNSSKYAAMAHLVASAVGRGMTAQEVTITDTDLNRLFPTDESDNPFLSMNYMQKLERIEKHKEQKVEQLLTRILGPNKASVAVTAELDLTYREEQSEKREDKNRVTTHEESVTSTSSTGVAAGGDPSISPSPDAAANAASETVDETVTESIPGITRGLSIDQGGSLKRLSVAVTLDGSDESLEDAAKQTELENLIKAAVGFNQSRGDDFTLTVHPFQQLKEPELETSGFSIVDLLPYLGYLAEAITVIFVLMALKRLAGGGERATKNSTDPEEQPEVELTTRERVANFVQQEPEKAREALMVWLKEEALP